MPTNPEHERHADDFDAITTLARLPANALFLRDDLLAPPFHREPAIPNI